MQDLLVSTTNAGKLREIRLVLADARVRLVVLTDLPAIAEPEETGQTFAENAILKARYYASHTRLPTVAEDSGLVIDTLGGRPGVLSARYPGETYPDKFRNLYAELAAHPKPWTARFVCSVALVGSGPALRHPETGVSNVAMQDLTPDFAGEATVEGEIAPEPRGEHGFGYDPIFFFPPYGCTLGEVTGERKLAVAHRGKAFRSLAQWLRERP